MKLPPIDLSGLVNLIRNEGRAELAATKAAPKLLEVTSKAPKTVSSYVSNLSFVKEWDNIIFILEKEVVPLLAKGCEAKALLVPSRKLLKSAKSLTLTVTQVLGFVPGPVGIVCSVINAIACFSVGNVPGGLFELLGCIPGGKIAAKSASKLLPKIEKILIEMVQSNRSLRVAAESASRQYKAVTEFFRKHAPDIKPDKAATGYGYGVRAPAETAVASLEQSLRQSLHPVVEARKEIGKYVTLKTTYGNLPKSNLWSHLGY
jgi:hypothetical protein